MYDRMAVEEEEERSISDEVGEESGTKRVNASDILKKRVRSLPVAIIEL